MTSYPAIQEDAHVISYQCFHESNWAQMIAFYMVEYIQQFMCAAATKFNTDTKGNSVTRGCLSLMTPTPMRNSQQKQPFLNVQIMFLCGIALERIWLHSEKFKITARSGRSSWDGVQSTLYLCFRITKGKVNVVAGRRHISNALRRVLFRWYIPFRNTFDLAYHSPKARFAETGTETEPQNT